MLYRRSVAGEQSERDDTKDTWIQQDAYGTRLCFGSDTHPLEINGDHMCLALNNNGMM